jgi:hypothetical protein
MSAQLSDVRLWHLFDKQYGDGLVVCIYHHEYVWRQSAAVLVRGADNVALAQGTSGDSAISDALDLLKNRVACVSAADLAAAQSSARLTWPPTVTLVVVVRAMSTASPRVFGPEGQYGPAVEDMVRQHAQANGAHRVVALVARVCDDPMQDAHRVAPKTFAEDWRRDARWPYVTHAAYISDLRLRTTDERIALFKRIPQATRLPFAIPTLALDTSPSPHLLAARSTSSTAAPNVAWSLLLTATGIDLQSLMSGDGSSSLSAKANPLVAHPVGHSSLRVWRAAPFPSTEPVGTDCVVAVNVDMWSEQLAAWRLVNVLDLPAVVAAGESGRVARVSLSLGVDSPLFVPPSIDLGDSRSGSPNRGMSDSIRRSSSSSLIEQRLSITRTLDLEVPIVDPINAFINLTGAAMSSSPLRRLAIADAAVKSVSQRLPSNAPEVQQLEELSEMIAQIENSSDGGRAMLEQRLRSAVAGRRARALISERIDIEFRRAMQCAITSCRAPIAPCGACCRSTAPCSICARCAPRRAAGRSTGRATMCVRAATS